MAPTDSTPNPRRDETSPLLAARGSDDLVPRSQQGHDADGAAHGRKHGVANPAAWAAIFMVFIILLEAGASLIVIPVNEILETIICRNHHPTLEIGRNSPICKDPDVQAELTMLRGWQNTLEFIPGLVTAVFYGFAADRFGRKIIFNLSLVGLVLYFGSYITVCALPNIIPVWMTLLCTVFMFIGGGSAVFVAMVYSMVSDITTVAGRSSTFLYLGAASLLGELIAGPTAFFLMQISDWLSVAVGWGCVTVALIVSLLLPDTLNHRESSQQDADETSGATTKGSTGFMARLRLEVESLASLELHSVWGKGQSFLLLLTFLLTSLGRYAQEILLQYVTKRYGWEWSQASLLLSIRATCQIALLIIILPLTGQVLMRKVGLSTIGKDLWLARGSAFFLALGAFGIGLADSVPLLLLGLVLYASGCGYITLIRSILASAAGPANVGIIFTTISFLENVGGLIAGPTLATSFKTGLGWGGRWIGLPFVVAGTLFGTAFLLVSQVRLPILESLVPLDDIDDIDDIDEEEV